ncbi:MAG: DUF6677 family protein [Planctomycetota bacterium]
MKKRYALTVLLAWLLPGLGHWYIGQRTKAILFCVLLLATFLTGVVITDGGCVDWGRHPYAFLLQAADGVVAFATLAVTSSQHEFPASKLGDLGMLYTLVAGALNVLLIADALYRAGPREAKEEKR